MGEKTKRVILRVQRKQSMSIANGKKYLELIDKREKLEGTRIFGMLLNLSTSRYTINRNYDELSRIITKLESDLEIWSVAKRGLFEAYLRELTRLLQNYLSSTYSLIEHYRHFCIDLHCSELDELYSEKVRKLRSNDCVVFVRDLRTFSQHIGLPLLSGQISIHKSSLESNDSEIKQRILLEKGEFERWTDWNEISKKYIMSHQEIELKVVLNEYQSLARAHYVLIFNCFGCYKFWWKTYFQEVVLDIILICSCMYPQKSFFANFQLSCLFIWSSLTDFRETYVKFNSPFWS